MFSSQQKITTRTSDLFSAIFFSGSDAGLRKYIPHEHLYWTGSGREALRQLFVSLKIKKLAAPAYTCHVVPTAIEAAGCTPVFYDSHVLADPAEIEKVLPRVDALLVCHNFGFMPDMEKIVSLCREHKVILVEDCAQALGATYNGTLAGGFGDYAIYSFGISKNMGFCNGLLTARQPLELNPTKAAFPWMSLINNSIRVIFAPVLLSRFFYPLTSVVLHKKLQQEQEALSYAASPFARRVILQQAKRYHRILHRRQKNAQKCIAGLNLPDALRFVQPISDKLKPAWLYFLLLTPHPDALQLHLLAEGVEVGRMYTFACLPKEKKKFPKAQRAEQQVLTFALYRDAKDIQRYISAIQKKCDNEE